MHAAPMLVALAAITGLVHAQSVAVTLAAVNTATLRADVGGQAVTQVVPAGPLANSGLLRAEQLLPPTGIAFSQFDWASSVSTTEVRSTFLYIAGVTAPPPSFADTTVLDVLMTVNMPASGAVLVELTNATHATNGSLVAVRRVDVGNDGSFEMTETSPPIVLLGPIAAGTSLPVRVQLQAAQNAEGTVSAATTIRVVPSNDLVIGGGIPAGCAADELALQPSFVGRGIALRSLPVLPGDLAVAVLGTTVQPLSLPPLALPCLLLPAPDVTFVLLPHVTVDVPLPAAVRPIGFWAQAVVVSSSGRLATTNSFSVVAF